MCQRWQQMNGQKVYKRYFVKINSGTDVTANPENFYRSEHDESLQLAKLSLTRADQEPLEVQTQFMGHLKYNNLKTKQNILVIQDLSRLFILQLIFFWFGINKSLSNICVFDADGEIALIEAFQQQYKNAIHLTCFHTAEKTVKRKLCELHVTLDIIREYIFEILAVKEVLHLFKV